MRVVFLYLFLLSLDSIAESVAVSSVVRVYDGDTITVNIDEWPSILGERIGIRIRGVDTPELRGVCEAEKEAARAARDFTRDLVFGADQVMLADLERGKYFRIVADVYADGVSVAELLLQANLARPYEGGSRLPWCD